MTRRGGLEEIWGDSPLVGDFYSSRGNSGFENPKDEQLMKPLLFESPHNFKEICPEERDCPGTLSDHLTLVVPSTALIKHRMHRGPAALPRDCRWPASPYSAKPHAGLGPIGRPYSN